MLDSLQLRWRWFILSNLHPSHQRKNPGCTTVLNQTICFYIIEITKTFHIYITNSKWVRNLEIRVIELHIKIIDLYKILFRFLIVEYIYNIYVRVTNVIFNTFEMGVRLDFISPQWWSYGGRGMRGCSWLSCYYVLVLFINNFKKLCY